MNSDISSCCENEHINLSSTRQGLQNENKQIRIKALRSIESVLEKSIDHSCVINIFQSLYAHILMCFSDKSELCRELSVGVLNKCIDVLPVNDYYLTYIIPVIVKRAGQPETVETCEELRLKLVGLVRNIITRYKDSISLPKFINDLTLILTKTCTDQFPKVKIESCDAIVLLSTSVKRDFHLQSESYIKPVLKNFSHQQCPVRVSSIKAIGAVVLHGSTKCLEDSFTAMAEKLFDDKFVVRQQVIEEVGQWMLNHKDRYSFWHRMIPLLLTGLSDAHPDVVSRSTELWNAVGQQYIEENEDKLKEKLDFDHSPPLHYPPVARPNLGCRVLVEQSIGKIIPAIINELEGWQSDACLRSAQLLSWLVLYAEGSILQHTPIATRCFFLGAKIDNEKVNNEIYRASELLGYFVGPDIWWELLSPEVDSWAYLGILSNIIKGTEKIKLEKVYLKKIVKKLSKPDRCRTFEHKYQKYLLATCENLIEVCAEKCEVVGQDMFNILFTVLAMARVETITKKSLGLLKELACTLGCGNDVPDICSRYVANLMGNITSYADTWSMETPDRHILEAVITYSEKAIGHNLHLLAPLLVETSGEKVDPKVKLRLFTNLSALLLKRNEQFASTSCEHLSAFLKILVEDVIAPNLVWCAGKSAESIRTSGVACLCAVLTDVEQPSDTHQVEVFSNLETLECNIDKLLPLLAGLLDDQFIQTRLLTMRAICCVTKLAKKNNLLTCDHLHRTYPVVMKRLDDPTDTVRVAAVQTICVLFVSRPDSYDGVTFHSHLDAVYSAMLIHLDDPSEDFVKETLDVLMELSKIHPKLLKKKIDSKMKLFKNKSALESLDKYLESLSI